ncbi:MAG: SDR family oxidoreductase [Alphaproteobacteria bacterium]
MDIMPTPSQKSSEIRDCPGDLAGKVAIVTGAGRGIGRAIAERFAAEGARVVVADIDRDSGRAVAEALAGGGGEALFVACDVGDGGQARALITATVEAFGALDVVVNNAGVLHIGDLFETTEADLDRVLRVNVKGPFLVSQAAGREMVRRGRGGAIVNLSSIGALMAIPDQLAYNVSKGCLAQLTRVMALALAPHRIRVNAVAPAAVNTEMIAPLMADAEARRRVLSRTPMGRLAEPREIAAAVAFLASEAASYVTGQTVYCDGGRLALNYTV